MAQICKHKSNRHEKTERHEKVETFPLQRGVNAEESAGPFKEPESDTLSPDSSSSLGEFTFETEKGSNVLVEKPPHVSLTLSDT